MYEKKPNNFNALENVSECFNYTMMKLQLGVQLWPIDVLIQVRIQRDQDVQFRPTPTQPFLSKI